MSCWWRGGTCCKAYHAWPAWQKRRGCGTATLEKLPPKLGRLLQGAARFAHEMVRGGVGLYMPQGVVCVCVCVCPCVVGLFCAAARAGGAAALELLAAKVLKTG